MLDTNSRSSSSRLQIGTIIDVYIREIYIAIGCISAYYYVLQRLINISLGI